MKRKTNAVEFTSKRLKLQLILSALGIAVAILWLVVDVAAEQNNLHPDWLKPVILLAASFVWRVVTKALIWWNHG